MEHGLEATSSTGIHHYNWPHLAVVRPPVHLVLHRGSAGYCWPPQRMPCNSTNEGARFMSWVDDTKGSGPLLDTAGHVIGCHATQETRVQHASQCRGRKWASQFLLTGCHSSQQTRVRMRVDEAALMGLAVIARHVTGCHSTEDTRVRALQYLLDYPTSWDGI